MFCKHCGKPMDDDATFCPSCGKPNENQTSHPSAPRPFEQRSVDESQNPIYQKTAFYGKQASVGASGSIAFGSGKQRNILGKLIRFGIVLVILIVAFVLLFNGDGISNVELGDAFNVDSYEITNETDTFVASTPEIFLRFDFQYDEGTVITANWYYEETGQLIDSVDLTVTADSDMGYVSLNRPTSGWPLGEYKVELVVDDEVVHTSEFVVE